MAEYTVQTIDEDGVDLTLTQVTATDTFDNDGKTFLVVHNESSYTITITIQANGVGASFSAPSFGLVEKADRVLAVADGGVSVFGPFPRSSFNDSNGEITVGYTGTALTSCTAAAIKS